MRVVTVVAGWLAAGPGPLGAQHAHQLEIGGFGAYAVYDKDYQVDNQFGGGGRLGYFLNEYIGIEVDASLTRPTVRLLSAQPTTQMRWASASLVLNSGGQKNILYVLGGYSRLDIGVNSPYNFANHAAHGGIGDRIFLTDRLALRLEARVFYTPKSCCLTSKWVGHAQGSAGVSLFFFGGGGPPEERPPVILAEARDSTPAEGQDSTPTAGADSPEAPPPPEEPSPPVAPRPPETPRRPQYRPGPTYEERGSDWAHQWYWGGQGGFFFFKTNYEGITFEPTFGGHWLITGKRTALYVAYEQSFFLSERYTTFVEPTGAVTPGNVAFKDFRKILVGVLAFPAQKRIEPFGGGGFAIMQALNVQATCGNCTAAQSAAMQDDADDAASKAFFFWMGGFDVKQGRLALYGHYVLTSSARGFILDGTTHTFQGGIRYSLGSAKEGVSDAR
jgi:hypothetical protein